MEIRRKEHYKLGYCNHDKGYENQDSVIKIMKPENLGNGKRKKKKTAEIWKHDAKTKPKSCMYLPVEWFLHYLQIFDGFIWSCNVGNVTFEKYIYSPLC